MAKKTAKMEEMKEGEKTMMDGQQSYNKLYKHLGPHANNNKDVRRQLQEEVDLYTDNQLGVSMATNMMPGYTLTKHNQISSFKDQYQGKVEEPVDKIYFRQKDEINQFAEAKSKALIILRTGKNVAPVADPAKK